MSGLQQGNQKGGVIPTANSIGITGSSYSASSSMKTPAEIGVKVGDSMDDVINGVKGVGFYIDQIGFGAPSTGLTRGMPLKPLGINYFIQNGSTCSNGAKMWTYMKGISEGDALGSHVKKAMAGMGFPPLQGLAPGMIEDVQKALNPEPLLNALQGSGYPQCRQVTWMVGDSYGNIRDPETGEPWISNPETAFKDGNIYKQTRWIQDVEPNGAPVNLTKEKNDSIKKTMKPDGTSLEGFDDMHPVIVISIGILCILAFGMLKKSFRSL